MSKHDKEHGKRRRRAPSICACDAFSAPKFLQRAAELRRMEQLPWPRNPFGEPVTIDELLTEAAQRPGEAVENPEDMCPCGCRKEHQRNVPQTLRNPYGRGFGVIYFRSDACKISWNRERVERQAVRFRSGPESVRTIGRQELAGQTIHAAVRPDSPKDRPAQGGSRA